MAKKSTSGASGKQLSASMAFKGIRKGTDAKYDVNGFSSSVNKNLQQTPGSYPKENTVKDSKAMNQHKKLAEKGHT